MSGTGLLNMELNTAAFRSLAGSSGLVRFRVLDGQTDLQFYGTEDCLEAARAHVAEARKLLIAYIGTHRGFRESLIALPDDENAPEPVRSMLLAGLRAELGPMAAVAGAIAEYAGRRLLSSSPEIIAENGGDVFFRTDAPLRCAIVAESARHPLISIDVEEAEHGQGMGVCTSSGRLGPSLNFGKADAVTVLAPDTALADALATASSNRVKKPADIVPAMDWAMEHGAQGIVVIAFDRVAAQGCVHFSE